jgi:hypothetical protein
MAKVFKEKPEGPANGGPSLEHQRNRYAGSTNRDSIGDADIVNVPVAPNLHQRFIAHWLGSVTYRVLCVPDGLTINLQDDVTGSYAGSVRWRSRIHLSNKRALNFGRNV